MFNNYNFFFVIITVTCNIYCVGKVYLYEWLHILYMLPFLKCMAVHVLVSQRCIQYDMSNILVHAESLCNLQGLHMYVAALYLS
jgi:hypothetical protein